MRTIWFTKGLKLLGMLVLLSLTLLAVDWLRTRTMPKAPDLPDLLYSIEGDSISLQNLNEDKPLLIYFWATWCGPCKATSPSIQWLSQSYTVVSVALDSGSDDDLKSYMQNAGYDFTVVNNESSQLTEVFRVGVTPTIVILKDNRVSFSTVGVSTPLGLWLRLVFA